MGIWYGTDDAGPEFSRNNYAGLNPGLRRSDFAGATYQNADSGDEIHGNGGADVLEGYGGGDWIDGGDGNDDIYGNNQSYLYGTDTIKIGWENFSAANDPGDELYGGNGDDRLFGQGGDDRLYGQDDSDRLFGEDGNDILDGGKGNDAMSGGNGDDRYIVDSQADVINETAGNGTLDRVMARADYALAADDDIEYLTSVSSAATTALDLTGNAKFQEIVGNSGANILSDGGAGAADVMKGLGGNDTYKVYNAGDTIYEYSTAGTADRVAAAVDYVLKSGVYIEIMTTNGSGGTSPIDLTGNSFKQEIYGNAGSNILNDGGKGAADTMTGLGGNDTYRVYNAGDIIVEASSQGTHDLVMAAVDYVLTAGAYVERLATNGTAGTSGIDLTGNNLAQEVVGNSGANILDGKGGNDTIKGLAGNDVLIGGTGSDSFVFNTALSASTNVDTITDFNLAGDTISLENAIFTALTTPGALAPSAFKNLKLGAIDASDRILYNPDTGNLAYDADGSGGAFAAVKFANIANHAVLTAADFVVI